MTRSLALAAAASAATLAFAAAQPPTPLAEAQPGLWEISGVPGAAGPFRECIADMAVLTRFEHRAKSCSVHPVRSAGSTSELDYSCGPAGFGHSQITLLTPRSLRIATQGISDGLPFNYVLQARRIAECQAMTGH